MATLPIHLEVEDVAVGPVLIALRKMPGIIKIDLKLPDYAPIPARQPGEQKVNAHERIMAMFMQRNGSPISAQDVVTELGLTKASAYSTLYKLNNSGMVKRVGTGIYELTERVKKQLMPDAVKLLPKPRAEVAAKNGHAKKKSGNGDAKRQPRGYSQTLLLSMLTDGPMKRSDVVAKLVSEGVSDNSVSGTLERAQRDKLAKSDGQGTWQLTDKGRQHHAAAITTPETT
ncbi:hypothetical protein [Bradyrhizobium sp. S3.7.6]